MQLIPFLPAVAIPKARQINDFSVPILVLMHDKIAYTKCWNKGAAATVMLRS